MQRRGRYAGLAILFVVGVVAAAVWLLRVPPAVDAHREEPALPTPAPGQLTAAAEVPAPPANPTEAPQKDAPEDCLTALAASASSRSLLEQKRQAIDGFLWQQGDLRQQAIIADLAGYARTGPDGVIDFMRSSSYLPPKPASERMLTGDERQRLKNLLQTRGVEALVAFEDAAVLQAHWTPGTSVVAHLIREHDEALYAALPGVADSLPVGLHELATAIEHGVAAENFLLLLEAADVDLGATWRGGANLAKAAAIRNRPAILRLLTARGVNPATRAPRYGAILDEVVARATLADAAPTEALADVLQQLIAAGAQPDLPSTLKILADWLPDVPLPPLHAEAAALADSVAGTGATVAAMDAHWARKIEAARGLERRCEPHLADFERADTAFRATDLAAKQRYQEALRRRKAQAGADWGESDEAGMTAGVDEAQDPREQELLDALHEVVEEGRWQDVLAIADQLAAGPHDYYRSVLQVALGGAPLEVVMALAERVGSVPDDAIWFLATLGSFATSSVATAEALEPFGLDLHYVDEEGQNAFTGLASLFFDLPTQWEFAEYLASRSVAVKPRPFGLDPLDRVLMELAARPTVPGRIPFARFLIDHGAPVESSHLELAAQLYRTNERAYRRLVELVPELASPTPGG